MLAAWPAAGPAFAVKEITAHPLDLANARFLLFRGQDPANPFVAGERSQVHPYRQDLRVG